MSTLMEIEKAIEELPALEFRALAAWLEVRKSGLAGECAVLSENSLAVDGKRMRPQAGGFFPQVGRGGATDGGRARWSRNTKLHGRTAPALPGTLWFLIDGGSTPPPHTAETAMPPSSPSARQRQGPGERVRPRAHQHAPSRVGFEKNTAAGRWTPANRTCSLLRSVKEAWCY
jgi:hypothetical protein